MTDDITTLQRALQRDDVEAFLREQREQLVRAVIRTTGVDRDGADDIVQDFSLLLVQRGGGLAFGTTEQVVAYLKQVAKHALIDQRRRERREQMRTEQVTWLGPHVVPEPEEVLAYRALLISALDDLNALSDNEREVFLLYHYEGLSLPEIDRALGLKPRQAESLKRQADLRLAGLRDQRQRTSGYLLLVGLLHRWHDKIGLATTQAAPVLNGIAGLAAAVAFAVFATVTPAAPTHRAQPPVRAARPVSGSTFGAPAGSGPQRPRATPRQEGLSWRADADPTRSRIHRTATITVRLPAAPCTSGKSGSCPVPRDGGTLTAHVLGNDVGVNNTAVQCAGLPANSIVTCDQQETGP